MTNGMPQLTLEPQLGEAAVEKQTVKSEPEKMWLVSSCVVRHGASMILQKHYPELTLWRQSVIWL